MNTMQSHRDQSHPPAGHNRDHSGTSNSNGYNNDNHRRRYDNAKSQSRTPSASRWEPPKSRRDVHEGDCAGMWGQQSTPSANGNANNRDHENNSRGAGSGGPSQGGGKATRRRHSSNDTRNQRNQYRQQQQSRPPPRPKKIIVTPEQPDSKSQPPTQPSADNDAVKLDPADPTHARRIQQRRRQVLFGKNTSGYEEYIKKVPKHKRRPRSLDCPATPDHTVDIPAKRWQGLMNAWRRALHAFDPPDLHLRQPSQDTIALAPRPCVTPGDVAQEEIAQAKASGLQVAFGTMDVGREARLFSVAVAGEETVAGAGGGDGGGPAGEATVAGAPFEEEAAYRQTAATEGGMGDVEEQPVDSGFLEESDSDSDDDVL